MPDADFADAYEADLQGTFSAIKAAHQIFKGSPRWMIPLLAVRNALVRPFGLVSTAKTRGTERIGFFPLLSVTENQVVMGLDDKHLDFRLVVNTSAAAANATHVVVSTVLKRHNLLGRAYLAVILPFHRAIVPAFIKGAQEP